MNLPFLIIKYADTSSDENSIKVTFISEYFTDEKNIIKGIAVFFIIAIIIVVIVVCVRMYVWTILNPYILSPDNYCLYFLLNLIMKIFKFYGILIFIWSW